MKQLVFAVGLMCLISFSACIGGNDEGNQSETVEQEEMVNNDIQTVTGVAVDGAMNSVYLKVGDDTVEFTYPDLDNDHRAAWDINDTLTVEFVQTQYGDSVTQVINESAS